MDIHIFIFRGQSYSSPSAGTTMDTTPKRKVGRPRINPIRPPKNTAKLAETVGRSKRFTFSISQRLRDKLNRLAAHNQITDGEQLRRLIDQAVIPDQPEVDPSIAK